MLMNDSLLPYRRLRLSNGILLCAVLVCSILGNIFGQQQLGAQTVSPAPSPPLPPQFVCQLRCTALCLRKNAADSCFNNCNSYNRPDLCNDANCWTNCKDLGPPNGSTKIDSPQNIDASNLNGRTVLKWKPVPDANGYVIQYKNQNDIDFTQNKIETSTAVDFLPRPQNYGACDPFDIRIIAISTSGASEPSYVVHVPPPVPYVDSKLNIEKMAYINQPYEQDFYKANGTIEIIFSYNHSDWPLGDADLKVIPSFHMIMCSDPDLGVAYPEPIFSPGQNPLTLVGRVGSDMMYRKCKFLYYVQSVSSKQCPNSVNQVEFPPPEDLQTVLIAQIYPHPKCAVTGAVKYMIIPTPNSDGVHNLTLNVTFKPDFTVGELPNLYYIGLYGPATNYAVKDQEFFMGVNITKVLGQVSSCIKFDNFGNCQVSNYNNSLIVPGINKDQLYGITICGVKDIHNTTLPDVLTDAKSRKPQAAPIMVKTDVPKNSLVGIIIGCVLGGVVLIAVSAGLACWWMRRRNRQKLMQFKMSMGSDGASRYTDMPKKFDKWEIERRNLIIHDKKLGSGAFGAVYLGRLIGKSLTHKDANSMLGVNLMRAENCEVAVKMLPEYADELSRSEFLKEIGLMKSLGYHERLVNMLACITESEPLCLIVEYCSDGDLLHFLRERCKYMMKLDEMQVNYHECPIDDNYDPDMIVTLKQLLMFAVQISYGLEYLSSKGYIHRDVAARNVLVHEKNACKIGDFGLCRYVYSESPHYKSKGGRLPLKWMSPEAIRHYEFSSASDVWSFGVLLFEIITLGGSPYPGIQPEDMLSYLEEGGRMEQPDNCPDDLYSAMHECWQGDPEKRPIFSAIRQKLASQLEDITEDYSYLKLDAARDYYNVTYDKKHDTTITVLEDDEETKEPKEIQID